MKPALNKWQIVFEIKRDWMRNYPGWYRAQIGLVRLTAFPPEGEHLRRRDYDGFLLIWRFWLPFEAGR